MLLGALIIFSSYALSRSSDGVGAIQIYFVGEFVVAIAPIIFIFRSREVSRSDGLFLSLCIGVTTFIITFCYSPLRFAFSDEYQHTLTAHSILATQHLFHANPALVVSPQFPGMEIVTTEISSLTGLSIFASGTVVAGISHVLMTALVFILAKEFGLSSRAALIAVVVLTTGYTYESFLSYYAYETFAIPFLIATLIFIMKAFKAEGTKLIILQVASIACGFLTIVSHHVTSYFMAVFVGSLILVNLFNPSLRRNRWSLAIYVLVPIVGFIGVMGFACGNTNVCLLIGYSSRPIWWERDV